MGPNEYMEQLKAYQDRIKELEEIEERFEYFVELSPNPILVHQEGKIVYVNEEAFRSLGAKQEDDLIGKPIEEIIGVNNHIEWRKRLHAVSQGHKIENFTYKLKTVDGRILDVECNGAQISYNNKPAYLVIGQDVTEKRRLQMQLIENEERYKSLFEYNANAVYSFDLDGNFTSCNKESEVISGFSKDELLEMDYLELIVPEMKADAIKHFQEAITSGTPQNFNSALLHKNGQTVHITVTSVPIIIKNKIVGVFGIAQNITEEVESKKYINHLAYHDYLTGLPNRTMLERSLPKEVQSAFDNNENFAVLFIDLDQFKRINDTMGHSVGDIVLKEVTKRLLESMDDSEHIFRQGGDEFIVIIPMADRSIAEQAALRILDLLSKPFPIQGNEVRITPSIGISIFPEDAETIELLIRYADMAMYQAKNLGKNTYCFYRPAVAIQ